MKMNVSFGYGAEEIMSKIDAETSRHAAFLRYQDGGSAYDALKVHTKDEPTIKGFIADAFRTVLSHFDGEGRYEMAKNGGEAEHVLSFYLPDFDQNLYEPSEYEVARYVTLSATARWLMTRSFGEYAKMVAEDSDASLNRLVGMLRTRRFPLEG